MCKYLLVIILYGILGISFGCQGNAKTSPKNTVQKTPALKPLPQEIKQNLFANCDYIDYTFYDFDFSMSQGDPSAVKSNLALLSDEVQENIPDECKPIGRKYYHINGNIVLEAELYFAENCLFYIYKKDNTTLFGNKLSPQGINFYNNLIQQASRARQQAQG